MSNQRYCRDCYKEIPAEGKARCEEHQKKYEWRHRYMSPEVNTQTVCASVEPDGVELITYHPQTGEKQVSMVSFEDLSSLCAFQDQHQDLMWELHSQQTFCPECGLCQAAIVERYPYHWMMKRGDTEIYLSRRWKCWNGHEYYTDIYNRYQVSSEEHESYQSDVEKLF